MTTKHELFTQIARQHLGIETLKQRNLDSLDFHDVGVVGVQQALDAAYRAGQADPRPPKLLAAAEALLVAHDNQMVTQIEWRRLRRAMRQAKKDNACPKP